MLPDYLVSKVMPAILDILEIQVQSVTLVYLESMELKAKVDLQALKDRQVLKDLKVRLAKEVYQVYLVPLVL